MEVEFSKNVDEAAKVADRAGSKIIKASGGRLAFMMDLLAADGVNGNPPIDFTGLLAADEFNFLHDVCGIARHLDRSTGELADCFIPRFARSSQAA
jgi:hypothetical protein